MDETNLSTTTINHESTLIENLPLEHIHQSDDNLETLPNYSLNTTIQAPLIIHQTNDPNSSYADIHLSINIFLPKKFRENSVRLMEISPFISSSSLTFSSFVRPVIAVRVKRNIPKMISPIRKISLKFKSLLLNNPIHCINHINVDDVSIDQIGRPICCITFVWNIIFIRRLNRIIFPWISILHYVHLLTMKKPLAKFWKVCWERSPWARKISRLFRSIIVTEDWLCELYVGRIEIEIISSWYFTVGWWWNLHGEEEKEFFIIEQ